MLDVCYRMLVSLAITVLTQYSTLSCISQSFGLSRVCKRWNALLSIWALEIGPSEIRQYEILGALAASVRPRKKVDEVFIAIAPRKLPTQTMSMRPTTVEGDEHFVIATFDH